MEQHNKNTGEKGVIARKSFMLYASSAVNSGIRLVTLAVVANVLGSGPLGMIAFAYAFIGFFQFLYQFGLGKAHIRRLADGEDPGRCVGAYIVVKFLLVAVTTLLVFGAFGFRERLVDSTGGIESQVFVLILASVVIGHLFRFSLDTFTARKEIARRVTLDTVENLIELPLILAIFFLAGGKNVVGLAWAHLASKCVWAAASVILFARAARHDGYVIRRPSLRLVRGYISFSIPLLLTLGMATLAVNLDMVMVREFIGNAALGNYHVATRVMMAVLAVSAAIMTLVLPTTSRYFADRDVSAMKALLAKSERYISMFTTFAAMGMVVFAEEIVLIFGGDFSVIAPPIVRLFGIVTFFTAINRPFSSVPLAVNRPWVTMKVSATLMLANLALNLFFMPSRVLGVRTLGLGAMGCALGTVIVTTAGFAWTRVIAKRLAGLATYRGILKHVFAATLTGALCFLLKPALLTGGRWEVLLKAIAMGVGALPVYCLLLASLGQFHRDDIAVFVSLWNPRKLKGEFVKELLGRGVQEEPGIEQPSDAEDPERSRGADLVLIDYALPAETLPKIIEKLESHADPTARIVLFRSHSPYNLFPRLHNLRLSEEYLEDGDYGDIDAFSFGLAERWHRFKGTGRGRLLSAGRCVEFKMAEKILQIVKDKLILTRIHAETAARSVVLYSGSAAFRRVARGFYREKGATLHIIECGKTGSEQEKGIYGEREWNGILSSIPDLLERIAFIRPHTVPQAGDGWCAIHDGSRFRDIFARAGIDVADYREYRSALPGRMKRWRQMLRMLVPLARNYLSPSRGRRGWKAKYLGLWSGLSLQKEFAALFNYRGMDFWPEIKPHFDDLFEQRLPEIACQTNRRRVVYRLLGVRAIIVNDDVQLSKRIDIEAARGIGARSLHVQHGVCGEPNGENIISTDLMAVWGEKDKDWYVTAGNAGEKIIVTGNPKFDIVAQRLARPPADWRVEHCPKAVVFATQPAPKHSSYDTDDEEEVLAAAITRAMSHFPDRRLVIKLHPNQGEHESMYRAYAERHGLKNFEILRRVELGRLLCNCELFITESSTAAMEAVLWDVPIMIVNLTRRPDIVPYVPSGVAAGVYDEKKIAPMLQHFFNNDEIIRSQAENRPRFIADYLHRIDGNSTRRVYELVETLALGQAPAAGAALQMTGAKI